MNKDDAWSTLHGHIHINLFTKHAWRVASKLLLIGARNFSSERFDTFPKICRTTIKISLFKQHSLAQWWSFTDSQTKKKLPLNIIEIHLYFILLYI